MTHYIDPRPGWVRQRTYELQKTGLSYAVAREQAETEADDKFATEDNSDKFATEDNGDNGNGGDVARMNARKYAWQILHAEIRRQAGTDKGLELDPQFENQGVVLRKAREGDISEFDILFELANLGATFALMTQNDPLGVARRIGERIMEEPDEDDG
jgi:hypothetical protein